jgi:hypothetical protein
MVYFIFMLSQHLCRAGHKVVLSQAVQANNYTRQLFLIGGTDDSGGDGTGPANLNSSFLSDIW